MCVSYVVGGEGGRGGGRLGEEDRGGGEWTFKNVFEALFPCLWKKETQGHFFTEK